MGVMRSVRPHLSGFAYRHVPPSALMSLISLYHKRGAYQRYLALRTSGSDELEWVDDAVHAAVGSSRVQSGFLAGLEIVRESVWGHDYASRLLGTYEMELHPALAELDIENRERVIDVGCADGYYAVGLARRASGAVVDAYDIDPSARQATAELAALDGVSDRVVVKSECTRRDLEELPAGSLIMMDCEGAEAWLLSRRVIRSNSGSAFVIECHDHAVPGLSRDLVRRFSSRRTRLVWPRERTADDSSIVSGDVARLAMDERRVRTNPWLVVT